MDICFTCDKRFGCFTTRRSDVYYFVIRRNLRLEYPESSPLVCAGGSLDWNMHPSRALAESSAESLNQQHGTSFIYTVESGVCADSFGFTISRGRYDGNREPFTEDYGITHG